MTYEVLTMLALPKVERRDGGGRPVFGGDSTVKVPGSTTSDTELKKHGQTDADIANLLKAKAIGEKA